MRSSARLLTAVLVSTLALSACGTQPSGGTSAASGSSGSSDTSGPGRTTPDQAQASAAAATGIPDDFPLSAGMAGPGDTIPTSRTGTGLRSFEPCGTSPLRGLGTRDRMVADNSGGEALHTRELVLLGSPDEAAQVAQAFTDEVLDCDRPTSAGELTTTTEVGASPLGPAPAAVLVQGFDLGGEPGTGHIIVHVVPVGAALLVTQVYGEWPDVSEGVDETADLITGIVAAMDVFAEGDTATPTPTPDAQEIPVDFPLLAGWPDSTDADGRGRTGPSRDTEPVELAACGVTWAEPPYVDRLMAGWESAEDYRTRQLTTYADDDAAAAAVADLVAFEQSCPTEPPGDDGFATERDVRPVALGDEAWAILERDTSDGRPSAFGATTVVVRVGRAVLVVGHGGHAGHPGGDGQRQVDAIGSQAAKAVEQMCQFTRTGC